MNPEFERILPLLIAKWYSLPESVPAELVDEVFEKSCGLLRLIHWIQVHPTASTAEYRAELAQVTGGRK